MLLKYMDWTIPIITNCFLPVIKNKPRRFQCPGVFSAAWHVLLESLYVLASLAFMCLVTLFEGFMLGTGLLHETIVPDLPPASSPKKGQSFDVITLDAAKGEVTPTIIRGFVLRSEPVIIKNMAKSIFSALAPGGQYAPAVSTRLLENGILCMNTYLFPGNLGEFGHWIQKHVQKWPIMFMLRFSGSYKSGYAHIDSIGSHKVYYVACGRKKVWICPRQYNHLLKFERGYNAAFVAGSDGVSPCAFWWMKKVPGVWTFDLEAGDVLIFNNTGCLHKFVNITRNPVIFALSLLSANLSPVVARNDIFNWCQARYAIEKFWTRDVTIEHPSGKDSVTNDPAFNDVVEFKQN